MDEGMMMMMLRTLKKLVNFLWWSCFIAETLQADTIHLDLIHSPQTEHSSPVFSPVPLSFESRTQEQTREIGFALGYWFATTLGVQLRERERDRERRWHANTLSICKCSNRKFAFLTRSRAALASCFMVTPYREPETVHVVFRPNQLAPKDPGDDGALAQQLMAVNVTHWPTINRGMPLLHENHLAHYTAIFWYDIG